MLTRSNILDIIADHQKQIDGIRAEMEKSDNKIVKCAIGQQLSYLTDNQYRYKMQARAWGMNV